MESTAFHPPERLLVAVAVAIAASPDLHDHGAQPFVLQSARGPFQDRLLVAFRIDLDQRRRLVLQHGVQRRDCDRDGIADLLAAGDDVVLRIEVAGECELPVSGAEAQVEAPGSRFQAVDPHVVEKPRVGGRNGLEGVAPGTGTSAGEDGVRSGVGPDVDEEIGWSQNVQQIGHFFELVQSAVDVAGQARLAAPYDHPCAVDPLVNDRAPQDPAPDLPADETAERREPAATVQGMLEDEFQGACQRHVSQDTFRRIVLRPLRPARRPAGISLRLPRAGYQVNRVTDSRKSASSDYRSRIYAAYATRGRFVEPSFDRAAAGRRSRYLASVLRGWLPEDRGAAITDLGCGSGEVLSALGSFGYTSLAGVDASGEQVRVAREIAPQVVEGDLFEYLSEHEAAFGLVTAFDVVEHLGKEEVMAFLDACHRALAPGGRLVLQTPNAESPWGPSVRYGDFTHETCFTPESLGWLLRLSGFEEIEGREAGPRPLGPVSFGRFFLWRWIRWALALWNLVETGSAGSGIYTRVFLISALKGPADQESGLRETPPGGSRTGP